MMQDDDRDDGLLHVDTADTTRWLAESAQVECKKCYRGGSE